MVVLSDKPLSGKPPARLGLSRAAFLVVFSGAATTLAACAPIDQDGYSNGADGATSTAPNGWTLDGPVSDAASMRLSQGEPIAVMVFFQAPEGAGPDFMVSQTDRILAQAFPDAAARPSPLDTFALTPAFAVLADSGAIARLSRIEGVTSVRENATTPATPSPQSTP